MWRHDAVEQSERGRADLSSSGVSLAYLTNITPRTDVRTARDLGMGVNAWTANSRLEARLLGARGVDGVIADRPNLV